MKAIANLMIVPLANSAKCIGKLLTNRGKTESTCATASDYVTIRDREFFHIITEKFPDQSLYSVSANRISDFFTDRYTKTRRCTRRFADKYYEIWRNPLFRIG